MPYYRRRRRPFRRKRRFRKKGSWMSSAKSAWSMAKKAYSYALFLRSLLNTELKYHDNNASSVTTANDAIVYNHITNIVRGDNHDERSGRMVRLKSIFLRVRFAATSSQTLRVFIVQKTTDTTGDPSAALIQEGGPTTEGFRNKDEVRNWRVLRDKIINIDPDYKGEVLYKFNIKNGSKCIWNEDSDTETYGHIYFFIFSTEAQAGSPAVYAWSSRVTYVDN